MKTKIVLLLIINYQLSIINFYAQGFNWVSPFSVYNYNVYGVKAFSDKIITFGISVDTVSTFHQGIQISEFGANGGIIKDSLIVDALTIRAVGSPMSYSQTYFGLPGIKYTKINDSTYNSKPSAYLIDSTLKRHIECTLEPPVDTNLSITYVYKENINKIVLLATAQPQSDLSKVSTRLYFLDTLGNILFRKEYEVLHRWFQAYTIHKFENYYYLVLNSENNGINQFIFPTDLYIYKLDTLGNIINSYQTNNQKWHGCTSSTLLPNGDFFVGGWYSKGLIPGLNNGEFQQKYIARFDKNLNLIWRKTFGISDGYSAVNKLLISSDSTLVGCGTDGINTFNGQDSIGHGTGCIFKFSLNGDSIWMHKYQAYDNFTYGEASQLLSVDELPNAQGFVGCGFFDSQAPLLHRGWVIKVDENGCLDASCTDAVKEVDANEEVFLYPNPANNEFYIQTNANLTFSILNLYNVFGALVCSTKITSNNINTINVSYYSNGFYTYQLINDKQNMISKGKLVIEHK